MRVPIISISAELGSFSPFRSSCWNSNIFFIMVLLMAFAISANSCINPGESPKGHGGNSSIGEGLTDFLGVDEDEDDCMLMVAPAAALMMAPTAGAGASISTVATVTLCVWSL